MPHQTGFIPTRRSLLTRLRRWDDNESWRDFFDTYWRLLYSVGLKAGLSDAEAQEMVQETVISVASKIKEFHYDPNRGSFKNWLLMIARRRIADQFRKRPKERLLEQAREPASGTAPIARIPDPASLEIDSVWETEWERNLLEAAVQRVKRRVAPLQFQIFELYVFKEWPVERIRQTLGVSAGQVYLAKVRVGKQIEQETRRLARESA